MLTRQLGLLALLAGTCATGSVVWRRSAPDPGPLDPLDQCLQRRFHEDDKRFGITRILPVRNHFNHFQPDSTAEQSAVDGLKSAGWELGVYLAGPGVLETTVTEAEWNAAGPYSFRREISRPVFVTGDDGTPDFPKPWEVWPHGQKALAAFASADVYRSRLGRWSVAGRPVRADGESCLKCHGDAAVGDALGVLLYVYARAG